MSDAPPLTRRDDFTEVVHRETLSDPWRWLEDQEDPEVVRWVEAQHAFARERLDRLPRREALEQRLRELLYVDSLSPPRHRGERYFWTRQHADRDKPIHYFRQGADGAEEVLLDPNALSDDGSTSVSGLSPSRDGRYVAYKLSRNNTDAVTLYVRDMDSGRDLERDMIEGAKYAMPSWTPDSTGFYYTWLPSDPSIPLAELPGHAEIRFHTIATDPKDDRVIHEATGDPTRFIGATLSRDGRFLVLSHRRGWSSIDVWFRDFEAADEPGDGPVPGFRPLVVGRQHHYEVTPWRDALYVWTDEDAPAGRVLKVDPRSPDREAWREIVPESDATLRGFQVIGDHLVLSYLRNARSEMRVCDLDGRPLREIELPGLGATAGLIGEPDEDEAWFHYSSFSEPPRIYQTQVATGETQLWHSVDYKVDTSDFEVEQVWYPSRDGTKISMFVVHLRGLALDGSHPTLLTGYGGFMLSRTPDFVPAVALWLEYGGVYALPNLRGGGEYGEEWHRAGMLGNKQNVFDDFIAAAEYLIAQGYTNPRRLAISGGSNGGLLVGAALTQRPDLFRAVICANPLLDMLRYHTAGSGKTWISEYGTAERAEDFAWLRAYSPYQRIDPDTEYPALLMHSAASDDRVDPLHARKFSAALQATAGDAPVWLRVERQAGHAGADLVRAAVAQGVDTYAFLLDPLLGDG